MIKQALGRVDLQHSGVERYIQVFRRVAGIVKGRIFHATHGKLKGLFIVFKIVNALGADFKMALKHLELWVWQSVVEVVDHEVLEFTTGTISAYRASSSVKEGFDSKVVLQALVILEP